jgi:RNA polymerase sigma-70 factor (ECF subfamily)
MRDQAAGLADAALTPEDLSRRSSEAAKADDLGREFEAAIAETLSLVFRVAYGVLRDRPEAEDVSQEAFAKAHRKFTQLRDRNALGAWLVRMTWRLAINRQRTNRRRAARELSVRRETDTVTAPDLFEREERAARLWAAIDALPPKLRIVTVLAAIEGHDVNEVAALLRLPAGTVKSRLFLARKRLKELLACMKTEPTKR